MDFRGKQERENTLDKGGSKEKKARLKRHADFGEWGQVKFGHNTNCTMNEEGRLQTNHARIQMLN